jgi:hypothetical protein
MPVPASTSSRFYSLVRNPLSFRLFMMKKLPAAWFSGLKLVEITEQKCVISIPYKWFTKNPFRSTYFACLSMAAEMSTGIPAMANVYKRDPQVSMLVISIEGKFYKKATGLTRFICEDGLLIRDTVEAAIQTSEPQTFKSVSKGYNENGEPVAEFWISWSFRRKG